MWLNAAGRIFPVCITASMEASAATEEAADCAEMRGNVRSVSFNKADLGYY